MSNLTVSYRQNGSAPWLGLPSVKNPGDATNHEMMASAGLLGWDVRLEEVVTPAKVDTASFEVLRTDPADGLPHRLGIVGERYTVVQNEALASMADAVTDGDVTLDAAGSYRKGRFVFLSFSLGENIVLDPNGQADEIGRFLTVTSSHDGSSGIWAGTGNMRLQCQNMLTSIGHSALSVFKMRHTSRVEGRVLDARAALSISFKASEAFEKEMQTLMDTKVSTSEFWNIVQDVFPRPEKDVKGSVKKWENKTDTIMDLWNGQTMANLDNTGYKAYNALNEALMWYGTVRAGNVENALIKASGFDLATNKNNLALYRRVLATTA